MTFDVFISHASEDKVEVAKPLASCLESMGYRVWYDEFELQVGDSLRRSIDKGLSAARFGVVVLSPSFFAKQWTNYELDGLTSQEITNAQTLILPIWHNVTRKDVAAYSPTLADRVALMSNLPLRDLAQGVARRLGLPTAPKKPLSLLGGREPVGGKCPHCGQQGQVDGYDGNDGDSAAWFECRHCGFFEGIE